jgi:eukaryotic-like serine/threonine-protein kinase
MPRLIVDRYELFEEIASGGMATVFLGRLRGGSGFARTVAIKRLHSHLARDPLFVGMFLDEARLAARIRHPNVVSTLDVVNHEGELFVVMDYVHGESLSRIRSHLAGEGKKIPLAVIGAIVSGILQGLHAAHEAKDEDGHPLHIVHRDVSPQNVLLGADGVARVVDFGVAKAAGRIQTTADGQVKGKASYMAPEQIAGVVDRRSDVFAASIILWELLTSHRLFTGDSQAETLANVLAAKVPSPRTFDSTLSASIEELVMAGLDAQPDRRFATAREMDQALLRAIPVASAFDVAEWLAVALGPLLADRATQISAIESSGGKPALPTRAQSAQALTGNISVSVANAHAPAAVSRSRIFAAVLVTLLLAGVGLLALGSPNVTSRANPSLAAPASTTPESQASAPPTPIPSSSSSTAAPPALATAAEASAPVVSAPVPRVARPAGGEPGAHKARPTNDCNPPYWIDAKGKHFKDQCL